MMSSNTKTRKEVDRITMLIARMREKVSYINAVEDAKVYARLDKLNQELKTAIGE